MISRHIIRWFAAALAVLMIGTTADAQASGPQSAKEPFTAERFATLQQQGALVLVDIWASWCPTCARQQEVLADFRRQHPDVPLHTLTVDFDKQKDVVKQFKAPRQSTFILYRGTERLWFAVAETRPAVIFQELLAAVPGQR